MAELLVKAIDSRVADPDLERRGCYKRGDVVVVFEDGHEWGREERPPKFIVVQIPGAPASAFRELQEVDWSPVLGPREERIPMRRRQWRLDYARLTRDHGSDVARGRVVLSGSALRSIVADATGRVWPGGQRL